MQISWWAYNSNDKIILKGEFFPPVSYFSLDPSQRGSTKVWRLSTTSLEPQREVVLPNREIKLNFKSAKLFSNLLQFQLNNFAKIINSLKTVHKILFMVLSFIPRIANLFISWTRTIYLGMGGGCPEWFKHHANIMVSL